MIVKPECPACGAQVNLGPNPRMGQHIFCLECDNELIVSLDPIELDWPFDDDDDDDEELDL